MSFLDEAAWAFTLASSQEKSVPEETKEQAVTDSKKAKKAKPVGRQLGKGTRQFLDFLYQNNKFETFDAARNKEISSFITEIL